MNIAGSDIIFEYLPYPLRGSKPFSIFKVLNDPSKISIIVLECVSMSDKLRSTIAVIQLLIIKSMLRSIPKKLHLTIKLRTIVYIVPKVIDRDLFEKEFIERITKNG